MKPLPLRVRVLYALELGPMSVRTIARVLAASVATARNVISDFVKLGVIVRCGVERGQRGHPWNLYRIAA